MLTSGAVKMSDTAWVHACIAMYSSPYVGERKERKKTIASEVHIFLSLSGLMGYQRKFQKMLGRHICIYKYAYPTSFDIYI